LKTKLRNRIVELYSELPYGEDKFVDLFVDFFKERFGDSLIAVIFYGSRIFESGEKDSLYDFYVIIDFYEKVHSSLFHILLNRILPPSVYFAEVELNGEKRGAKYNVISFSDFEKSISSPSEIYIVGRFAKRFYFAYTKNQFVKEKISDLAVDSMYFCLIYTIPFLADREKFSIEELVREVLSLSYKGEVRIDDPQKIDKIYLPFRDFYISVFYELFDYYLKENEGVVIPIDESEDIFQRTWAVIGNPIPSEIEVINFLKSSARKGVMRWPKGLITFKGYREYLERKARKSGENLNLTEADRKLPLIFGWRHVIKLLREGKLKSGIQKEIEKKMKEERK
jgi:hypothetical protein